MIDEILLILQIAVFSFCLNTTGWLLDYQNLVLEGLDVDINFFIDSFGDKYVNRIRPHPRTLELSIISGSGFV